MPKIPETPMHVPFPLQFVEMLLQSCVATTTLQKGGGNQKGAEFFQSVSRFLSKIAACNNLKDTKVSSQQEN